MPARFAIAHLVHDPNLRQLAADLAVSERTVQRWLDAGVNWEQADEFATRILNVHPASAFGPEWCAAAGYDALVLLPDIPDDCTVIPKLKRVAPGQLSLLDVA